MVRSDLNSVLVEGKIIELHLKDFIIQNFRSVEDTDGITGRVENQFKILLPYDRKYPLEKGMKVRIVGKLQSVHIHEPYSIVPDHLEIIKQE